MNNTLIFISCIIVGFAITFFIDEPPQDFTITPDGIYYQGFELDAQGNFTGNKK